MNIQVTFERIIGTMKPLNGICCAPYSLSYGPNQKHINRYLTEGNIPVCRLHDCCGAYGGTYFVDITNVFPNFDADECDPASYDFYYSDEYITAVQDTGCEVYYRLGETIEWGSKKYRTNKPRDFEKWARICEHIVRHYNEGWANGFHYNIRYWEIWNEPENPGNAFGSSMWGGTKEEFFKLYEVATKHLRSCFPDIKLGGYGGCGFYALTRERLPASFKRFIPYFTDFLSMVKETGSPLDFYSWHIYTHDEHEVMTHAKYVRETLNAYGFISTESHLNEWNIGDEGTGYADKHSMKGGSFLVAVMSMLQNSDDLDMAMYYCFSTRAMYNGFMDQNDYTTSPAWYPFAAFGKLCALGSAVAIEQDGNGIYAAAARGEHECMIIVSNYKAADGKTVIRTDARGKAEITRIDSTFNGFADAPVTVWDNAAEIILDLPLHTVALIRIIEE